MRFFKPKEFTSLPEALVKPDKCKILNLLFIDFNLKAHGPDFAQLVNLRELYVQADPSIYDLQDFELPSELGNLKKLEVLSFLNVPIKQFPEWTIGLPRLRYLMLRGNDLTELPEYISELKSLKTLRIENCPLASLPESIRHLDSLKELLLCDTRLTDLRASLFPPSLKKLNFSGTGCYDIQDLEKLKKSLPRTRVHP